MIDIPNTPEPTPEGTTPTVGGNHLKCPDCGHECPLTDATGKTVQEPQCPKCHVIYNKRVKMVEVNADGVPLDSLDDAPELSGKDMNALVYLLLKQIGTIEIPQEVFDSAPGPDVLKIEMQWDKANRKWRFFSMRKRGKNKNTSKDLIVPRNRGIITTTN